MEFIMEPCLGIDFGSSEIHCAISWKGLTEKMKDISGSSRIPAYVALYENEWLFGREAKNLSESTMNSAAFGLIRFLAKTSLQAEKESRALFLPLEFCQNHQGTISVNLINTGSGSRIVSLTELTGKILSNLKEQAEYIVGKTITSCAITFADDDEAKVQTVKKLLLSEAVGFLNVKFLKAQDAFVEGCISRSLSHPEAKVIHNFILVDIGAEGTRVYVMQRNSAEEDLKLLRAAKTLSGVNFIDHSLLEHCMRKLSLEHHSDLQQIKSAKVIHRLRLSCEEARFQLSTKSYYDFNLPDLQDGRSFRYHLPLKVFEKMCGPIVQEIVRFIILTVDHEWKNPNPSDTKLLLVGGGARIPLVRRLIKWSYSTMFEFSVASYADEAAAHGAARRMALCRAPVMGNALIAEETSPAQEVPCDNQPQSASTINSEAENGNATQCDYTMLDGKTGTGTNFETHVELRNQSVTAPVEVLSPTADVHNNSPRGSVTDIKASFSEPLTTETIGSI